MRPRLLLLDEPSSGIAQREVEALTDLLRRVQAQLGATMVVIEHDIPMLRGLADQLYAMETGRVIAHGTPDEVLADPDVIRSYLGTDPVALERSGDGQGGFMTQAMHDATGRGPAQPRWLRLLERVELPLGLALLGVGFLAVGLAWLEASGTADVRVQLQDLISGAVGGLALVVAGATLLLGHAMARAAHRLEAALTPHKDAAEPELPSIAADVVPAQGGYVATHASYHRPGCDLLGDGVGGDRVAASDAAARGLTPCGICVPEVAA